ncbi:GDP-mannose 4,6-dehydratase [Vreelandella arctica]|uniref:GDP-mannose 4,6-dehydratase n=1 Tax=Vreelandella arctica TaxID=3126499 RepID=UPI00300E324E
MPTALVTGASGFTGHYMVEALVNEGFQVVGLGSRPTAAHQTLACDLTDASAVKACIERVKPNWVIHLAALSFVGHEDQRAFYDVNVFGTLNLLQALASLETPPERILVASSANVYGTPDMGVIDESICPAPVNHYACSKLAMEHMVANWFERLPIVITRPFNYTGPGQDSRFLIPKIVEHFAQEKSAIELGNIDVSRDFSDVRDVVAAYMALLESTAQNKVVNISSGTDTALRAIIEKISALAGYDIEVSVNPAFVRPNEIPRLCGANARLKQLTGWEPCYHLDQTLEDMLNASRNTRVE